jgi:hypothetical protein
MAPITCSGFAAASAARNFAPAEICWCMAPPVGAAILTEQKTKRRVFARRLLDKRAQ